MTQYLMLVKLHYLQMQDEWMETEVLPEMTIDIPGVFDSLTDQAGNAVQELGLGTVWNEWNTNWISVDIAGTELHKMKETESSMAIY